MRYAIGILLFLSVVVAEMEEPTKESSKDGCPPGWLCCGNQEYEDAKPQPSMEVITCMLNKALGIKTAVHPQDTERLPTDFETYRDKYTVRSHMRHRLVVDEKVCHSDTDCDDGDSDTIDFCDVETGGECYNTNCDDNDPCTDDSYSIESRECTNTDLCAMPGNEWMLKTGLDVHGKRLHK